MIENFYKLWPKFYIFLLAHNPTWYNQTATSSITLSSITFRDKVDEIKEGKYPDTTLGNAKRNKDLQELIEAFLGNNYFLFPIRYNSGYWGDKDDYVIVEKKFQLENIDGSPYTSHVPDFSKMYILHEEWRKYHKEFENYYKRKQRKRY